MRWFLSMAAGFAVVSLTILLAPPVTATVSGENGLIVFVGADAQGWEQIYAIEPNGANLTKLTSFAPGLDYSLSDLAWSPDGRWLAFQKALSYGGYPSNYILTLDGSTPPDLPPGTGLVFSPDGKSVLYRDVDFSTRVHDLSVGTDTLVLASKEGASDGSFAWMPDGRSFVFARTSCGSPSFCGSSLYRVDVGTGIAAPLTTCQPGDVVGGLDVNPSGERIAVMTRSSTSSFGTVSVCDLESGVNTLVQDPDGGPAALSAPSFSPDGSLVAAAWDTPLDGAPPEIRTATLTGSSFTTLAFGHSPVWQPLNPYPMGLVDTTQGEWHLRHADGTVDDFYFGDPGDVPFMGDWDCDGTDTPGLYRQSDGYVYLRNSNTQGIADIRFFFGNPGDVPIAGDFNGDGCDTVSIYRPSNQTFHIINELGDGDGGLGTAEYSFSFGNPGDQPFTGDLDGDGIDEVGLHRASTGFVYYRTTLTTGSAHNQYVLGDPGDRFVTGDWNHDGIDTPAVYRPSTTTVYFRFTNTQGNANAHYQWGQPDWTPVTGTHTHP